MARSNAALKAAPASPAPEEVPPKPRRSRSKLVVLMIVVLLCGSGGGWWWWKEHQGADQKSAKKTVEPKKPPQFVNIDQFVVNLHGDSVDHYLQTAMVLSVSNNEAADAIKVHMPIIRNRILLLLSNKNVQEFSEPGAKEKLAAEIRSETRLSLPASKDGDPNKGVEDVLFSAFVIQ